MVQPTLYMTAWCTDRVPRRHSRGPGGEAPQHRHDARGQGREGRWTRARGTSFSPLVLLCMKQAFDYKYIYVLRQKSGR